MILDSGVEGHARFWDSHLPRSTPAHAEGRRIYPKPEKNSSTGTRRERSLRAPPAQNPPPAPHLEPDGSRFQRRLEPLSLQLAWIPQVSTPRVTADRLREQRPFAGRLAARRGRLDISRRRSRSLCCLSLALRARAMPRLARIPAHLPRNHGRSAGSLAMRARVPGRRGRAGPHGAGGGRARTSRSSPSTSSRSSPSAWPTSSKSPVSSACSTPAAFRRSAPTAAPSIRSFWPGGRSRSRTRFRLATSSTPSWSARPETRTIELLRVLEGTPGRDARLRALADIPHVFVGEHHGAMLPTVAKERRRPTRTAWAPIRTPDAILSDMFLVETEAAALLADPASPIA